MAQFLQVGLGQDPLGAGLRLLPWGVAPFLIAPRAGRLADRIGERPLVVSGLLLQAAGWPGSPPSPRPALAYAGAGRADVRSPAPGSALAIPAVTKAVVGSVPRGDIGKASGGFSTMRQLGGAFGVAILAAVFAAAGELRLGCRVQRRVRARRSRPRRAWPWPRALAGLALPGRPGQVQDAPAERVASEQHA